MPFLIWPVKDPNEVLDYEIDWSDRIDTGDQITGSTWSVPSGLTGTSPSYSTTSTTIWLSGGTNGETYSVLNRITTEDGRTMDQTVKIKVKTK